MPSVDSCKVIELLSKPILYNSKLCALIHHANVIYLSSLVSLHFLKMSKLLHLIEERTVDQKYK